MHVSKTILKGGGKKVWLLNWNKNVNIGHEMLAFTKKDVDLLSKENSLHLIKAR